MDQLGSFPKEFSVQMLMVLVMTEVIRIKKRKKNKINQQKANKEQRCRLEYGEAIKKIISNLIPDIFALYL